MMTPMSNLDYLFQGLRLKPSLQYQLLEECFGQMTGAEVAGVILRELGRTDVKVFCTKDQRNCYDPMLNFVGLSADIANSKSILAVAIAAHEVGHALQPRFMENFGRFSKVANIFDHLSLFGEMFLIMVKISISLFPLNFSQETNFPNQTYKQFQKNVLLIWILRLLLLPITWPIVVVCTIIYLIFLNISLLCMFIRRLLIFITEIHASKIALRLLQEYKILDINQQNIARKFLFYCALTYLRSSRLLFY